MRIIEDYQRDIVAYRMFLRGLAVMCDEMDGQVSCLHLVNEDHPTVMTRLEGCAACKVRKMLSYDHPGDCIIKGGFFEDRTLF